MYPEPAEPLASVTMSVLLAGASALSRIAIWLYTSPVHRDQVDVANSQQPHLQGHIRSVLVAGKHVLSRRVVGSRSKEYDRSGSRARRRLEEPFGVLEKIVHARCGRAASCDEPEHGEGRVSADADVAHAGRTQLADGFGHQRHSNTCGDEAHHRGHLWCFLNDARAEAGILASRNDRVVEHAAKS